MIRKLKPKSEFNRNVLTLMTGTTIAQAIPIAISPILTRIYTPEDFGVFALYMSISSIIAVVATGRYELAIMLPKKDEDAINIVALSIIISFFVSFIALYIVYVFNSQITNLLGNPEISNWLYFIPLTVLLTGIYQSFNYWNNRKKQYKRLAINRVIKSGATSTTNLGMGFSGFGSSGLIVGGLIGQGLSTFMLGKMLWKEDNNKRNQIKKLKMFAMMKKYKEFPKINSLHAFFNTFSSNLPIIIISYFFQNMITGFYTLAHRVLLAPMNIVTSSYGQVFLQKMTYHYNMKEKEEFFLKNTLFKLMVFSFPFFFIFFIFSPEIFSVIFGSDWYKSGVFAQILVPMLYLRFTGSIVSSVTIIYNEQKKALNIEIVNTIFRLVALIVGGVMNDILLGLILFSLFSSLITIYRLFWYLKIIREKRNGI